RRLVRPCPDGPLSRRHSARYARRGGMCTGGTPGGAPSRARHVRKRRPVSTLRRWGELTREELGALAPEALLLLPIGSTEQHGPHLPTSTDAALVTAVAERAAEAAEAPETIVLAPTLAYGASQHHLPFGATLSLRPATLALVL